MATVAYLNSVYNAALGKRSDGFEDAAPPPPTGLVIFVSICVLVIIILNCFSAARVSYCYNIFNGETPGIALLWAVLCWFFPYYYHIFYGVFLNPLCNIKMSKGLFGLGGKR